MPTRHRAYVFTWNNYTSDDEKALQSLDCGYLVYGHETAPSTGTLHLQGYVRFENPKSFTAVKALLSSTVHVEVAKGTAQQNRAYCVKQDTSPFEKGTLPAQGKRNDLLVLKALIDTDPGVKTLDLFEASFSSMVRYQRSILSYRALKTPPRRFKTYVHWFHGATGTGKSRRAFEAHPDAYSKNLNHKWWDGYDNHEVVILDDLRPDHFTFNFLLKLFDRYPLQVEIKGGTAQFISKVIVCTSCFNQYDFCQLAAGMEDPEQLLRRIDETSQF